MVTRSPKRLLRTLISEAIAPKLLLLISVAFATAIADPVVINFEDLQANGLSQAPTLFVNRQYQSKGVVFNNPIAFDFSLGDQKAGFAHSGTKAIEQCYGLEFCTTPIEMNFGAGQVRVKVWVGYDTQLTERRVVVMEGFNTAGATVATTTATLDPNSTFLSIRTPLEISSARADIVKVWVHFSSSTPLNNHLAVDDVEFDTLSPPPPCQAMAIPTITLLSPPAGQTVQVNEFALEGSITTGETSAILTTTAFHNGTTSSISLPANNGSFGTSITGLLSPGPNTVAVLVQDCRGSAQVSSNVIFSPIAAGSGFLFKGLDVIQTIQDPNNSVPLISNKRTLVRVYLGTSGSTGIIRGVGATLSACRPAVEGSAVCGSFLPDLQSLNAVAVDSSADVASMRSDLSKTLNFELPPDWTNAGLIHFQISHLQVGNTVLTLPCTGCDNPNPAFPIFPRYYSFQDVPPVSFLLYNVEYQANGTTYNASLDDLWHLRSWLQRAYPTNRVVAPDIDFSSSLPGISLSSPPSCAKVNTNLFINKIFTKLFGALSSIFGGDVQDSSLYYGIVADGGGFMRGCSTDSFKIDLGITDLTIHVGVGSGPTGDPAKNVPGKPDTSWDKDTSYGDWYGGHEIGHLHGRQHPGFGDACDGTQNHDDPNWPMDAAHANGLIGWFGFDFGDASLGIPSQLFDPTVWTDVMTYRCNEWISDYTYEGILSRLKPSAASGQAITRTQAPVVGDGLVITGTINLATGAADLSPFFHLSGIELSPRPVTGQFSIDLLDGTGHALAHYPFEVGILSDSSPTMGQTGMIVETVPYVPGTRTITISRGSQVLASRQVSPNSPQVKILYPNGGEVLQGQSATFLWQGQDADGDTLTYTLLYSADAGRTWLPFATGITGTSQQVSLGSLAGSDHARFRVIASDGVNTGSADSASDFHVPYKAPQVRINSPADNSRFTTAQTIRFTGEAFDRQDGYLSDQKLQWTSDRQGVLGFGRTISAQGLMPGTHIITLQATNSGNYAGSAVTRVQIVGVFAFNVPGDLNGDGKVDCGDLAIVSSAFGKHAGEPGFDPRADVNADGVVDLKDSSFVAQQLPSGVQCTLQIANSSLPNGHMGVPYSQYLATTGGVAPFTWRLTSGRLPFGLALNASTGEISGTPTSVVAGSILTFQVTDSSAPPQTASAKLTITIDDNTLGISTVSLAPGQVGIPYAQQLMATGGTLPYHWELLPTGDGLPPGVTLDGATGKISGTPTAPVNARLIVRVTDSSAAIQSATGLFRLTIVP
jgi:hypothetical protein